jgi:hypothetical protein
MTPISASIAQADQRRGVDAIEQASRFLFGQHRRLAPFDDVLGAPHGMRRIDGEHLADDEPVEQYEDGGEVQLRRLGGRPLQHLDIGSDMNGLDVGEPADLVPLDLGEEVIAVFLLRIAAAKIVETGAPNGRRRRRSCKRPLTAHLAQCVASRRRSALQK